MAGTQASTVGDVSVVRGTEPRVVMSHAGVQHSYQAARALQEADLLEAFYSTIHYDPARWPYALLDRSPLSLLAGVRDQLKRRRSGDGLDARRVHELRWPEVLHRGVATLVRHPRLRWGVLPSLRNAVFDRHVARELRARDFEAFYGYSGSALHSLKRAREMGKTTIIDQHDVHFSACAQILEDDVAANPDFEDMIPFWPPYQPYLERVDEENRVADYHLVPSTFARRSFAASGLAAERVLVVPFGVDVSRFHPNGTLPARDGEFRVLYVGAIGQRKGIKYLLEAVKQLALPKCRLLLVGNVMGKSDALRPYADVFQHMTYVGHDALPDYYRRSHVFVMPSLCDSFGLVILEAMACGVPVIVTENTGGPDVVRDGRDGFVVPAGDADALKEKLELLHDDGALREEMGQNAAHRAHEFTCERYRLRLARAVMESWRSAGAGSER